MKEHFSPYLATYSHIKNALYSIFSIFLRLLSSCKQGCCSATKIDPASIQSIVIRCPNWLGDAVMATAVLQEIRQLFPHSKIIGIGSPSIGTMFEHSGLFDCFFSFHRDALRKKREEKRIAQMLRYLKCDLGILLTRSFSSAWMMYRAKIPRRLGLAAHYRSWLLTDQVQEKKEFLTQCTHTPHKERHDVETYRLLLHKIQGWNSSCPSFRLSLTVTEKEKKTAQDVLQKEYAILSHHHTLICINPGAAYGSAKCWPKESFKDLINRLIEYPRVRILVLGDEKTQSLINDITLRMPPRVINLAGKTSLRELMAYISLSDGIVTNDSGPMHLASALNVPLVALFGSTNPHRTGPFNGGQVIYKHASCSPCYLRECPIDFRCMTAISVDEVITCLYKAIPALSIKR